MSECSLETRIYCGVIGTCAIVFDGFNQLIQIGQVPPELMQSYINKVNEIVTQRAVILWALCFSQPLAECGIKKFAALDYTNKVIVLSIAILVVIIMTQRSALAYGISE